MKLDKETVNGTRLFPTLCLDFIILLNPFFTQRVSHFLVFSLTSLEIFWHWNFEILHNGIGGLFIGLNKFFVRDFERYNSISRKISVPSFLLRKDLVVAMVNPVEIEYGLLLLNQGVVAFPTLCLMRLLVGLCRDALTTRDEDLETLLVMTG